MTSFPTVIAWGSAGLCRYSARRSCAFTRKATSLGQVFLTNGWEKPEGFCPSAWDTLSPFVLALSHGGENFYDSWMKNPKSAMLSCNDGFRPVSFLVEALDEDAD